MPKQEEVKRLRFKTFVRLVRNSVDSNMFRNYFVVSVDGKEFDALGDGSNSCAFYVSSILVIFGKINSAHGTVDITVKDLVKSGWKEVVGLRIGDVIVWEEQISEDGPHKHIGFYIGDKQAVSTSIKSKTPVLHEVNFGSANRAIETIFRLDNWDD